MKYKNYKFDDFVLNESFINYATNKNQTDVVKWEKWFSKGHKNKETALEAKMLILQLRFKKCELPDGFVKNEWLKLENTLKLNDFKAPVKNRIIFKQSIWQYAAVACVILFFMCAIFYLSVIPKSEKVVEYQEIIVPKGEIQKIILPDKTTVFINSDSKLKYNKHFGEEKREVILEGEACFDVEYDPETPFIVHTFENDITVLGTAFDVFAYPNENIYRASLERGKISVSHNSEKAIELKVNQNYQLLRNSNQAKIFETKNVQSYSSWKEGKIVFRNQRFTDILRKLERSHNVIFNLQNKKVENCKYTGTFTTDDEINTILDVIKYTTLFEYEIVKDTVIIK